MLAGSLWPPVELDTMRRTTEVQAKSRWWSAQELAAHELSCSVSFLVWRQESLCSGHHSSHLQSLPEVTCISILTMEDIRTQKLRPDGRRGRFENPIQSPFPEL